MMIYAAADLTGAPRIEVQMIALGLLLLAAHLGGKLCHRLNLSDVTGQLVAGAMVGAMLLVSDEPLAQQQPREEEVATRPPVTEEEPVAQEEGRVERRRLARRAGRWVRKGDGSLVGVLREYGSDRALAGVVVQLVADGVGPDDLNIASLVERAGAPEVKEIVLAVNATVDGQTTAHYITDRLEAADVNVSRLAHGVPVGGELDYLDEGTLAAAIKARRPF